MSLGSIFFSVFLKPSIWSHFDLYDTESSNLNFQADLKTCFVRYFENKKKKEANCSELNPVHIFCEQTQWIVWQEIKLKKLHFERFPPSGSRKIVDIFNFENPAVNFLIKALSFIV